MSTGVIVVLAAVVIAVAFGGYRLLSDGRFRGTHEVRGAGRRAVAVAAHGDSREGSAAVAETTAWSKVHGATPAALGERATLVQFSSAFCAPCRAARRVLGDVATKVPGVVHVEIDAEHHLELVRELGVLRTPTTLILDRDGREVARAAGAPRTEQVLNALP